jgi:hypothetical protein
MPTSTFVDETLVIAGFTVDVNGKESADGDVRPRVPDAGDAGGRIQFARSSSLK